MLSMISEMKTSAPVHARDHVPTADQRIVMTMDWAGYKKLLALRGERRRPKLAFLNGAVELMTTSREHEWIKSWLGRLLEAFCLERDVPFSPYGEWTQLNEDEEAAAEPDECYVFGNRPLDKDRSDLVVEVIWTHGGLDKLEIYKRLNIREVWFWDDDAISVHVLGPDGYARCDRSTFVPDLDLAQLCRYITVQPASEAIKQYRAALRGE